MVAKATKILWLSRHHPDEGKERELRRVFGGEVDVHVDDRPLSPDGAQDVLGRMRSGGFAEVVLVAPTSILSELCQRGIKPLWPKMLQDRQTFEGFDRVLGIRKNLEDVQPVVEAKGRKVMWLSRFAPAGRQMVELRRLFGDDVVVTHRDIPNVERAVEFFRNGGFEAIVAVVPEAVFERLSTQELPLLRSEAIKENDPSRIEFRGGGGQGFRFDRYVWYRIEKVTERL
ncbi:MAG: hypothetical protein RDU25_00505 [Patescibacteria group bacterium]|nr:hypothetical protein [Patescibacteria group bacterium]